MTVARYFDHLFQQFFYLFCKSEHHPIHESTDYFMGTEYARRGTVGIHWFLYIKNAPQYTESNNYEIHNLMAKSYHVY